MIGVVLLHTAEDSCRYSVAKKYTQLSFDYCMADRLGDSDYEFLSVQDLEWVPVENYDYCIILTPGVILEYSYWESKIRPLVEKSKAGHITFDNPYFWIVRHTGTDIQHIKLDRHYPYIDASTEDSFAQTHTAVMTGLVQNSNISYIIHNEIPQPVKRHDHLDFVMTVSSGFYINFVLHQSDFSTYTSVHHLDVSPMSLRVRKYTIDNWNGKDFYAWMDHLYEKFPLLEVFNGRYRLHSHHPSAKRCWQHVQDTFGDKWLSHWKRYQQCQHTYNTVNFGDNQQLRRTLDSLDLAGAGAFWWNGALKRMPANVLKNSRQSFTGALDFVNTLAEYNPNIAGYGSDHCVTPFNGNTVLEISDILVQDSREALWKKY